MGTNPLLANALDLDRWADNLESRGAFPELVRRLLAQTPGVTNIDIRTHEGIAAPGWDGTATSDGSSFLPKGELRFEFGTDKQTKAKADKDYNNRAKAVVGKSEEIFVFATPRNWAGAASWAKGRRQEGVFASVEAYDAHRLEGWLQSTPAVHYWLSEKLGKPVLGAQTLTSWWEEFRGRMRVEIPSKFHIAGREEEQRRTLRLLKEGIRNLAVQASWSEDALAFLYAALKEGDLVSLDKTLVVRNAEAWQRLAVCSSSMILVPMFKNPDYAMADRSGHTVIRALGSNWMSNEAATAIILPKIRRDTGANILMDVTNIESSEAYDLAGLAVRNMATLYRSLSQDREHSSWAQGKLAASVLAPLVLVGAWEAKNSGDLGIISEFLGNDSAEINETLEELKEKYPLDPPFVQSGGVWRLVDSPNAAALLLPRLSEDLMEKWGEFVETVLLCKDPLEGLSTTDLILAQLNGERSPVSSYLREYCARGIALASATCDMNHARLGGMMNRIDCIVSRLLNAAFVGNSDDALRQLACSLQFLAEASPDVFLDYLDQALQNGALVSVARSRRVGAIIPISVTLFDDLCPALECLCWSPYFFGRASRFLVKLADSVSGEKERDRCLASLEKVLLGWAKVSAGGCDDKVAVLKWAIEEYPNIGWRLLEKVLTAQQIFPLPYRPMYRDWGVKADQVSMEERVDYVRKVLSDAIRLAEYDAGHWLSLLSVLEYVSPHDRLMLSEEFRKVVDRSSWNTDELLEVYLFLNGFVGRHRAFAQASWALSAEELQPLVDVMSALELGDEPRKFAWLFNDGIDISINGLSMLDAGFSDALHEKQAEAISVVLGGGMDQLRILVESVKRPYDVGRLLGESNLEDDLCLFSWLAVDSPSLRKAAHAYFSRVAERRGVEWVCSILKSNVLSSESKKNFVSALPAEKEYWEVVDALEEIEARAYWENLNVILIEEGDKAEGVERLLEHGCAAQAIRLLAWMLHDEQEVDVAHVVTALSGYVASSGQLDHSSLSYDVAQLLKWLEQEDIGNPDLPMLEFRYFDYVFDHEPANALYRSLGKDPDGFASLVQSLYSTDDMGIPEESRSLYKKRCWSVLYNWKHLPGLHDDGNIDGSHLADWIDRVRTRLSVDGSERDYDGQIGEILASSPEGKDGMWPAEEVRDILESRGNPQLEAGLLRGRVNRRGVTSRGLFDGGLQEAALAQSYREHARRMNARWPRTAAILSRLAQDYECEALREDIEAERRGVQD